MKKRTDAAKEGQDERASQQARRAEARAELRRLMECGLVEIGERAWTREELHQR